MYLPSPSHQAEYSRVAGDVATALEDADALLGTNPIPIVPERNNYEELKNSIQQTADFLDAQGRPDEARVLLERLTSRFPNTQLAVKLADRIRTLEEAKKTAE